MEFKHYNRLIILKEKNNLTDNQMASIASILPSDYKDYESGEKLITKEALTKYCLYFNVSPDYIFLEDACI